MDHLLDKHKDCLPSKEDFQNECTADGRPLQTKGMRSRFCASLCAALFESFDNPLC